MKRRYSPKRKKQRNNRRRRPKRTLERMIRERALEALAGEDGQSPEKKLIMLGIGLIRKVIGDVSGELDKIEKGLQ